MMLRTTKPVLPSTRALMSEKKKGELHPKFKGYYITPAGRFPDPESAAQANGTYGKKVYRYCLDPRRLHSGWGFEPVGTYIEDNPVYQQYLTHCRNGVFTNGKKQAHYDINKFQVIGFSKRHRGENVSKGPVRVILGETPLISYPKMPFAHRVVSRFCWESSFSTSKEIRMSDLNINPEDIKPGEVNVTTNKKDVTEEYDYVTVTRDSVNGNRVVPGDLDKNDVRVVGDDKKLVRVLDREVYGIPGEVAPSFRKHPPVHPAPPLDSYSRQGIQATNNADIKRIQLAYIEDTNGSKLQFKNVSILLVVAT